MTYSLRYQKWCKQSLVAISFMLMSSLAMAQPYSTPGEDTILIEKQISTKIPYHTLAKSLVKRFFNFNTDSILSFGEGRKDNVIRHFNDLSKRAKYRVNVDRDEIEFKLTVNL